MLFLADLLKNSKSTPTTSTFIYTYPRTSNHATTAYPESDWDIITPEETTAFYTDRITLFLGPPTKQRHHILLRDIPKSSTLLTYMATLDPAQRYTHIAGLDILMIKAYLKSLNRSVDALAIEASWLDIIKLAITAEALQDARMEIKALSVLREKGIIAEAPGNALGLFNHRDFAFAREYQSKIGGAQNLMRMLCEVGGLNVENSGLPKPKGIDLRGRVVMNRSGTAREKAPFKRCGNSGGRGRYSGVENDEEDSADVKVYPVSQPSIPPSMEVLRAKHERNFVWPCKKVKK